AVADRQQTIRAHGGVDQLDDAGRTPRSGTAQRFAQAPYLPGFGHRHPGPEPVAQTAQADAEDDEESHAEGRHGQPDPWYGRDDGRARFRAELGRSGPGGPGGRGLWPHAMRGLRKGSHRRRFPVQSAAFLGWSAWVPRGPTLKTSSNLADRSSRRAV